MTNSAMKLDNLRPLVLLDKPNTETSQSVSSPSQNNSKTSQENSSLKLGHQGKRQPRQRGRPPKKRRPTNSNHLKRILPTNSDHLKRILTTNSDHLKRIFHLFLGVKHGKKICKHTIKKLQRAIAPKRPIPNSQVQKAIALKRPIPIANMQKAIAPKSPIPIANIQNGIAPKLPIPIVMVQKAVAPKPPILIPQFGQKRKRGRPPKIRNSNDLPIVKCNSPKRKRGRPPKIRQNNDLPMVKVKYNGPKRKRGRPPKVRNDNIVTHFHSQNAKLLEKISELTPLAPKVKLTNVLEPLTCIKKGFPEQNAGSSSMREPDSPKQPPKCTKGSIVWAKHSNGRFYKGTVKNIKTSTTLCVYFSDDQSFSKEVLLNDLEDRPPGGKAPHMGQKLKVRREDGKVYDADCVGTLDHHLYTVQFRRDSSILELNQDSVLSHTESIPINIALKIF